MVMSAQLPSTCPTAVTFCSIAHFRHVCELALLHKQNVFGL